MRVQVLRRDAGVGLKEGTGHWVESRARGWFVPWHGQVGAVHHDTPWL